MSKCVHVLFKCLAKWKSNCTQSFTSPPHRIKSAHFFCSKSSVPVNCVYINSTMDLKVFSLYKCNLCKFAIHENQLNKHHEQFHPKLSYSSSHYTFDEIVKSLAICNICTGIMYVSKQTRHHESKHREIPSDINIFELIDLKKKRRKGPHFNDVIRCNRCTTNIKRCDFIKHFRSEHPDCLKTTTNRDENESDDDDISVIKYYKCGLCKNRKDEINEVNLQNHHSRTHPNVSYRDNKFVFIKSIKDTFLCCFCPTMLDQSSKRSDHLRNHHSGSFKHERYLSRLVHLKMTLHPLQTTH